MYFGRNFPGLGTLVRRVPSLAICALASATMLAETQRFTLLIPATALGDPTEPPPPTDLIVEIGSRRYQIESIERFNAATAARPIVVLDLAYSAPANLDCMLGELLAAMSGGYSRTPVRVFVTEGHPGAILRPDYGWKGRYWKGADTAVLRPARTLDREVRACADARTPERRSLKDRLGADLNIRSMFWWISNTFPRSDAPIRVFWLDDTFDWFRVLGDRIGTEYVPNAAYRCIEAISRADVTVYPVLMPDRRMGERRLPSARTLQDARYFAQWMGGEVTTVDGAVGESLGRAIAASERSYLLRLNGPRAGRTVSGGVPELKVRDASGRVLYKRPFVAVQYEGYTEIEKPAELHTGATPLEKILRVTAPQSGSGLAMRVEVPSHACSGGGRTLEYTLKRSGDEEQSYYQRTALAALRLGPLPPTAEQPLKSRPTTDLVCRPEAAYVDVPLPAAVLKGGEYSLVLHDPKSDWFGVLEFEREKP